MSKYDEFDLDLQNTKVGGVTPNTTTTFIWCPTLPLVECITEQTKNDCDPNSPVTFGCQTSYNCDDGSLKYCKENFNI